jgi:hypothetical protein
MDFDISDNEPSGSVTTERANAHSTLFCDACSTMIASLGLAEVFRAVTVQIMYYLLSCDM